MRRVCGDATLALPKRYCRERLRVRPWAVQWWWGGSVECGELSLFFPPLTLFCGSKTSSWSSTRHNGWRGDGSQCRSGSASGWARCCARNTPAAPEMAWMVSTGYYIKLVWGGITPGATIRAVVEGQPAL